MTDKPKITQERLRELLTYDSDTGVFKHKKTRKGAREGSIAGSDNGKRQIRISLDGRLYLAHKLAWLYVHGIYPDDEIDHINRVRNDNRICNLRIAKHFENMQNFPVPKSNTSGFIGVSFNKNSGKWEAYIRTKGRKIYLGKFDSIHDAVEARKIAKRKHHTFSPDDAT